MIDVAKSALLIMHVQNDIVKPEGKFAYSGLCDQVIKHKIFEKIAAVAKASRDAGVQVIYCNVSDRPGYPEIGGRSFPIMEGGKKVGAWVTGSWGAAVVDEVKPEPNDWVVRNYATDCFMYTDLDILLRSNGITDLYLAGTATTFIVDSVARHGAEIGYNIIILEDCCTSFTDEMHDFEIKNVLPYFGTIIKSNDFIGGLPSPSK